MTFLEVLAAYSGLIFMVMLFGFAVPLYLGLLYNTKHNESWPLRTSIPTAIGQGVGSLVFYALAIYVPGNYFEYSALGGAILTLGWSLMAAQRVRRNA